MKDNNEKQLVRRYYVESGILEIATGLTAFLGSAMVYCGIVIWLGVYFMMILSLTVLHKVIVLKHIEQRELELLRSHKKAIEPRIVINFFIFIILGGLLILIQPRLITNPDRWLLNILHYLPWVFVTIGIALSGIIYYKLDQVLYILVIIFAVCVLEIAFDIPQALLNMCLVIGFFGLLKGLLKLIRFLKHNPRKRKRSDNTMFKE